MSQKDLESVVVVLPVSMNRSVFLKTTHVRQIQDFGTPKWMYISLFKLQMPNRSAALGLATINPACASFCRVCAS